MRSIVTSEFRQLHDALPAHVQRQATQAYVLFAAQPDHRSLHFKKIVGTDAVYSARVGRQYRVIGVLEDDTMTWFWIGSHTAYKHLLKNLKE